MRGVSVPFWLAQVVVANRQITTILDHFQKCLFVSKLYCCFALDNRVIDTFCLAQQAVHPYMRICCLSVSIHLEHIQEIGSETLLSQVL